MILKKSPIDFIVVGLGNPGTKYEKTRHNAGFMAIDKFAAKNNAKIDRSKFHALTGTCTVAGCKLLLLKPQTFMNNSGQAVREAMDFYKLTPDRVLIMFDDISLEPGVMRIRRKGSAGGQKGMKSIIEHCSSEEFPRIKIGVGAKPHPDYDLADWVLSNFTAAELKKIDEVTDSAAEAAELIIKGDIDGAMSRYSK